MSNDTAVIVRNLSKCYRIYDNPKDRLKQSFWGHKKQYYKEFWALKNVSLEVGRGETLGIVGQNGSGKSTLLQIITGTLTPTAGEVIVDGRINALLELGSGFSPDFTGRENVFMNASILGITREEIENRFDEIAAFADIGEFLDQPVKTYSSGMLLRLAFAVQVILDPKILIVDEALAVGDAAFQRKCIARLESFIESGGVLLFVSHDLETVRRLCKKALYLQQGEVKRWGMAKQVCDQYEKDLFGAKSIESTNSNPLKPWLDQSLESPVCLQEYGSGSALITDCYIESESGERINTLQGTSIFSWCYLVEFMEDTNDCIFGMLIKTREGINVYGLNTQLLGIDKFSFKVGDKIRVKFQLKNNLCDGIYYFNCGVSTDHDGNIIFLHRKIDAAILKVSCSRPFGLADLKAKADVEPL